MRKLEFFASGLPKAQPRPRACLRGNHAGVYNPTTTNGWKTLVKLAAKREWDRVQFSGPIFLSVQFSFPRPKAHSTKKGLREGAPIYHTCRPDLDNCTKAVMDALTDLGIWQDDSFVCMHSASKIYSEPNGCLITIEEIS